MSAVQMQQFGIARYQPPADPMPVAAEHSARVRCGVLGARIIEFLARSPVGHADVARKFAIPERQARLILGALHDDGRVRKLTGDRWECVVEAVPVLPPPVGSFW